MLTTRRERSRTKRNGWRSIVGVSFILFCFLIVLGLKWSDALLVKGSEQDKDSKIEETPVELSAWITDWDWEAGLQDLDGLEGKANSIQVFGIYFDEGEHVYIPSQIRKIIPEMIEGVRSKGVEQIELTFVNDRFQPDGSIIQKDPRIVTHLVATEKRRRQHIEDILATVEYYNVDGVEIDYERVSAEDWPQLILLYEELYQSLTARGKTLRIILEPRTPLESIELPAGPTYVMMAYNLFGFHSGPGPKADFAFLRGLSSKLKTVPGEPYIALATGGFVWDAQARAKSVTEAEAVLLASQSSKPLKRDKASAAVYFEYINESNQEQHMVWYADQDTLTAWMNVLKAEGYSKFALWRFGGLSEDTRQMLKNIGL